MAENYVVNYSINVNTAEANSALMAFQSRVSQLTAASSSLEALGKTIGSLKKLAKDKLHLNFKIDGLSEQQKIAELTSRLQGLEQATKKKYNSSFKFTFSGEEKLDKALSKAKQLEGVSKTYVAGVSGTGTSTGTSGNSQAVLKGSANKTASTSKQKATGTDNSKPAMVGAGTGKGKVSKSSIFDIPANIGYKALGPTPLPSNGGIAVDMLKGFGMMYGLSGLSQAVSAITSQSFEYDNIMKTVENITKSHDDKDNFGGRFNAMAKTVRDVGMETKYTVTEVADAAKFLAMAGFDVDTIRQAMRPTADIALIGDTDLGQTADMVTNIMTAYKINPEDMRGAADVMANTFTMSNTTLTEIAESYKYAAAALHAGGIGFEEATAGIGILGDAGIKGSQAGTTLRTIMANLSKPTQAQKRAWDKLGISTTDKNGNIRPLLDIFSELQEKNLTVGSYYALFNRTASSGAIALTQNVDKWRDVYLENLTSAGLSQELANAKKNTLQGLWAQVESVFVDTGVTAFNHMQGTLRLWMNRAIDWLKSEDALNTFNTVGETATSFISTIVGVTKQFKFLFEAFSPVLLQWMKFQLIIWPIVKSLQGLASVWAGLQGFRKLSQKTVGPAVTAVSPYFAGGFLSGVKNMTKDVVKNMSWPGLKEYRAKQQFEMIDSKRKEIRRAEKSLNAHKDSTPQPLYNACNLEIDDAKKELKRLKREKLSPRWYKYPEIALKSNLVSKIGSNVGSMGLSALAGFGAMNSFTQENADWGDYTAGSLMTAGGFAAAAGFFPLAAGLVALGAVVDSLNKNWGKISELKDHFTADFSQHQLIDGALTGSDSRTTQLLEYVWRKNYDINELIARRIELSKELYGVETAEATTATKDISGSQFGAIMRQIDERNGWNVFESRLAGTTAEYFNKYGAQFGLTIDKQTLTLPDGTTKKYNSYAAAIADAAAAIEQLRGGYYDKIIAENQKRMAQMMYEGATSYDVKNWAETFNKRYNPFLNLKNLIAPDQFNVSLKEAKYWDSERIGQSLLGELLVWYATKEIREAQQAVINLKEKLELGEDVTESEIIQAISASDNDILGQVLKDYDPNNIADWFARQGYQNGRWVGLNGETPDTMAKLVVGNMTKLQESLKLFNLEANPAAQNLKLIAEFFLNLAQARLDGTLVENNPEPDGPIGVLKPVGRDNELSLASWGQLYPNFTPSWGQKQEQNQERDNYVTSPWKPTIQEQLENLKPTIDKSRKKKNGEDKKLDITGGAGSGRGGASASDYSSHYRNNAAPKQVIVRIGSLMNVDKVDLSNPDKAAVVANLKNELAQALVDVVHDFDETWHG